MALTRVQSEMAGAGQVLQVVNATYSTTTSTSSTSFSDIGLTATITPKFATSKILILVSVPFFITKSSNDMGGKLQLVRNSTAIYTDNSEIGTYIYTASGGAGQLGVKWNVNYLDSPATTSATTYKVQQASYSTGTVYAQAGNSTASVITLLEIAQ